MNILLTNDDGIESMGVNAIYQLFSPMHNIYIFAPDSEKSGSSHSLTLNRPIKVKQIDKNRYKVFGTPVDCIIAANQILFKKINFDLVISGLNRGQNLGEDIFYSGTFGAAHEAMLFGKHAIATSICATDFIDSDFICAAKYLLKLIKLGLPSQIE